MYGKDMINKRSLLSNSHKQKKRISHKNQLNYPATRLKSRGFGLKKCMVLKQKQLQVVGKKNEKKQFSAELRFKVRD